MWQYAVNRALLMVAQASGAGAPANEVFQMNSPGSGFKHTIWHSILLIIYFVICLGLVVAVLLQTTKNEGLSGVIGGSTQSVFKGKKGFEEHLQEATNYLAVTYLVMSLMVAFIAFRVK